MILTGLHGEKHDINEKDVLFARPSNKEAKEKGNAMVLWNFLIPVIEDIKVIGAALKDKGEELKQFSLPNKDPIWINAKKCSGPIYMPPGFRVSGNRCWIEIGGKNYGVSNEPGEVARIILQAGGTPRPVIEDSMLNSVTSTVKQWFSPAATWDNGTD